MAAKMDSPTRRPAGQTTAAARADAVNEFAYKWGLNDDAKRVLGSLPLGALQKVVREFTPIGPGVNGRLIMFARSVERTHKAHIHGGNWRDHNAYTTDQKDLLQQNMEPLGGAEGHIDVHIGNNEHNPLLDMDTTAGQGPGSAPAPTSSSSAAESWLAHLLSQTSHRQGTL